MALFVLNTDPVPAKLLESLADAFPLRAQDQSKDRLTYLDTFDWRVSRAGLTLAASLSGEKVRLTLLTEDGRVLETRAHRVPDFASELPEGPFREALESAARIRRLFPMAEAEWEGAMYAVLNEDDKTVVRLFLLEGNASLPGQETKTSIPPRIQLLALKGYEREQGEVASFLRKQFKLKPEELGEFSRVLDSLGVAPEEASPSFSVELDPGLRSDLAAKAIHEALFETMMRNKEGVLKDWDPEFLHDFRVALRRTRSALTQMKGVFPETLVKHYAEEFRWLGARTGPARDIDVYVQNIPAYRKALPRHAGNDLEPLVRFLEKKKVLEHERLVRSLNSQRFTRLVKGWRLFLRTPGLGDSQPPNASRPILEMASERIWAAFSKILKKGKKTTKNTSPEALHRLRIDCKKLRYLLTFFRNLYPQEALAPLVRELKTLQDHLGDFNDLQVQRRALRKAAEEMMAQGAAPPATLLAMGQLMGQLEARQDFQRDAFTRHFKRFARAKNQRRFRELFGGGLAEPPGPEVPQEEGIS